VDDFKILPGVERLKSLREWGFDLIGVSNQSGVAKGIIQEGFVKEVNKLFVDTYGFTDFYYCPHAQAIIVLAGNRSPRCFIRRGPHMGST